MMQLSVFGSSSAGNCYIIHSPDEALVIEAGVRVDSAMLQVIGYDPRRVAALIVSHHHADHSAHARQWMELGVPIRALPDVVSRRALYSPLTTPFSFGRWFRAGRFRVLPFPLVHYDPDGTPCPTAGFLIDHPDTGRVLFATDTAALAREEMTDDGLRLEPYAFAGVATWLIEANYDDYILHLSDLPKAQKDRIRQSHLSVNNTVATLRAADLSRTRLIVLLHLSDRNSVNNEQKIIRRVRLATGKRCCIARPGLSVDLSQV